MNNIILWEQLTDNDKEWLEGLSYMTSFSVETFKDVTGLKDKRATEQISFYVSVGAIVANRSNSYSVSIWVREHFGL